MSKEKLLDKMRKLKALANDPTGNPNEVASAAARLQELMLKHGLDQSDVEAGEDGEGYETVFMGETSAPPWKEMLLDKLAKANHILALHSNRSKRMVLVGPPETVAGVTYLFEMICSEIQKLWDARPPREKPTHERIREEIFRDNPFAHTFNLFDFSAFFGTYAPEGGFEDFARGAVSTIAFRLEMDSVRTMAHARQQHAPGLMRLEGQITRLVDHVKATQGDIAEHVINAANHQSAAFQDGARAGHHIPLGNNGPAIGQSQARLPEGR